jgi:hypothetical protein
MVPDARDHESRNGKETTMAATQGARITMADGSIYLVRRLTQSGRSNAKLSKNDGKGYRTLGLSLAPHRLGAIGNVCPYASRNCVELCLNISGKTAGGGSITEMILRARIARARFYFQDRAGFLAMLKREIARERARAARDGDTLIVRLNVISDIDWARVHTDIITENPEVIFYGYTKNRAAMQRYINGQYPPNYHLTFSRSETNEPDALDFLAAGANVAVVFDTKYTSNVKRPLPSEWKGFTVVDGDETDLRFLDPRGVVVGLRAKGRARRKGFTHSGFVVPTDQDPTAPRVIG